MHAASVAAILSLGTPCEFEGDVAIFYDGDARNLGWHGLPIGARSDIGKLYPDASPANKRTS